MKNIKVWTSEQRVSGAVSPGIASALAAFKGQMENLAKEFQRPLGATDCVFNEKNKTLDQLKSIEELTLNVVAGQIIADAAAMRQQVERWYSRADFNHTGRAIVLSSHSLEVDGYVYLRQVEDVVEVQLKVSDSGNKNIGDALCLWSGASFDLAYDWVLDHREHVLAELGALMKKSQSDAAVEAD